MKRRVLAIFLFSVAFLCSSGCRQHPSPPVSRVSAETATPSGQSNRSRHFGDKECDSLLVLLMTLENRVRDDSLAWEAAREIEQLSFDSVSGCFFVAGKGVFNKSHPQEAQRAGREMAATYDAKRWAVFLKIRSQGRNISIGDKFSGEITYSNALCQRLENDTLIILLKVPTGSIIPE